MGFGISFYKCNLILIVPTVNFTMGKCERAQLLPGMLSRKRTEVTGARRRNKIELWNSFTISTSNAFQCQALILPKLLCSGLGMNWEFWSLCRQWTGDKLHILRWNAALKSCTQGWGSVLLWVQRLTANTTDFPLGSEEHEHSSGDVHDFYWSAHTSLRCLTPPLWPLVVKNLNYKHVRVALYSSNKFFPITLEKLSLH